MNISLVEISQILEKRIKNYETPNFTREETGIVLVRGGILL